MLAFYMGMDVKNLENLNTSHYIQSRAFKNFRPNLKVINYDNQNKKIEKNSDTKVKVGVLSAAILATMAALYGITKKNGKNPFKNYNIFKQEIGPYDVLKLTGITVPVSLFTGIALDKDKKNIKPKIRESISQLVGNILTPVIVIGGVMKMKDKIDTKTLTNPIMKCLKGTHKALYTAVALVGGLFIGNKIANKINHFIFPEHKQRPLKLKDFSVHVDDVCFATSLILKGNPIGKLASKIIPATFLVSAYEAGTKTKNDE